MADQLLALDVGGTFTDAYLIDPSNGQQTRAKAPTTPEDQTQGVLAAAAHVLEEANTTPEAIDRVLHGTTTATNALLENEGARTALVTNAGFEDVLEIGRQQRPWLYDLDRAGPPPLVPRDLRFGLAARLGPDGRELEGLDEEEIERVAEQLDDAGVEAIAVGLLHAHRFPRHEEEIAEKLAAHLDQTPIVTSAQTSPEPREVERFTTTVVNARLGPLVSRYLDDLEDRLAELGVDCPIRVLDSAGATVAPAEIASRPVSTVLSGPAGGAAANRHLAHSTGGDTLLGVDMGGTSTDVSLVQHGEATTRWELEVAGRPLQIPAVDVHTIGAGGGSIAWRDEAGGLQVGPASAGADPGPACYDRGGSLPTVTDANLVLDRIPPSAALAGELELVPDRALEAITSLGDASPTQIARSVLEIAIARTARGLRSLLARHAVDPEQVALAAFGGAGPQFGAAWARELGFDRLLVPAAAGVTSAKGLLAAPARVERSQGMLVRAEDLSGERYDSVTDELAERARQGLPARDEVEITHLVSARYAGQSHELTARLPAKQPTAIREAFEARHETQHGYTLSEPVEIVALRVRAQNEPLLAPETAAGKPKASEPPSPFEHVDAVFVGHEQRLHTPVYPAAQLASGTRVTGPAILSSEDATTLVPPDARARVLASGTLLVTMEGST